MHSLFISSAIFILSIILAVVSSVYFQLGLPNEISFATEISNSMLLVWAFPFFIFIILLHTYAVMKEMGRHKFSSIFKAANASVIFLLLIQVAIVSKSSHVDYDYNVALGVLVGIVVILIANYIPRLRAILTASCRFPRHKQNEEVAKKLNYFAANSLILAGIIIVSLAVIVPTAIKMTIAVALCIFASLYIAYMYFICKRYAA